MTLGSADSVMALWGTGKNDVYAVGENGLVRHYDGLRWSVIATPTAKTLLGLWGRGDDMFAVGDGGVVVRGTGTTIVPSTSGPNSWRRAWHTGSTFFLAGSAGTLLEGDGVTWTPHTGSAQDLSDLWGTSTSDVYVVGDGGTILHWNGSAFSPAQTSTVAVQLFGAWGIVSGPTTTVFAVGAGGTILRSTGGGNWTQMTSNTNKTLQGVWGTSATNVYAVSSNGTIHYYNGSTWTELPTTYTQPLYAIWGSGPNDILVVGGAGMILHFDGSSWKQMESGTTRTLWDIDGNGVGDVLVVGDSVVLRRDRNAWSSAALAPPLLTGVAISKGLAIAVGGSVIERIVRGPMTCLPGEKTCQNGWDDDCDGTIDACDADCAGLGPPEQCADLVDNDCDGAIDCADSDCATFPFCTRGGFCQAAIPITCGSIVQGTTVGAQARFEKYGCPPFIGDPVFVAPEAVYRLTTATATTVTIQSQSSPADVDLFAIRASGTAACDPENCILQSAGDLPEQFASAAGQTTYIVVDGVDVGTPFSLFVQCQ
jgi:hypothetical protein